MEENATLTANRVIEQAIETASDLLNENPQAAEMILKQLLRCDPEHPGGLQLLGLCKHRMGQNPEAIEIIQTALDMDPTNSDNWNNIGLAWGAMEDHERAIDCLKKAIKYKPSQYVYLNNLALQYRKIQKYPEAIESLEEAIAMEPAPQMLVNLGSIYGEMKDLRNAMQCYERAVEVAPDYPPCHVDLAFGHFVSGDWAKGFEEYEWRFDYYPQLSYYKREYDQDRRWRGESLEGKRLLIYCEQGVGDGLQFIRYTKDLKYRGADVLVHCAASLNRLFERVPTVDQVVNRDIVNGVGPAFPEYDYQCAIMSLPHLLEDYQISGSPYLEPATTKFRGYLEEEHPDKFRVGVVWAGSPAHPHDQQRSIPLRHFLPLQDVPKVQLFSLQLDTRKRKYGSIAYPESPTKDVKLFAGGQGVVDYCEGAQGINLVDLTYMIQDFEDTATILVGLDLLICCDTAVLHLAGALGVPCWGLIPYNPDWRWGLNGDKTVWYDSVRLFRQEKINDWESVLAKVKNELHQVVLSDK